MTTFNLPAITNPQVVVNNSAVTVISGVANNSVVLHDFLGFRASGTTNRSDGRNYPLRVLAAAQNLVYDRINFRGNIPETLPWENWYGQTGFTAFNGTALQHIASGINSTMNDCVWGIRDDLSSGGADCVHHKTGNLTINRPRNWCGRDDFLEVDDANGRTVTINDGFFENQFVWLSGTGNIPNTFIFANNCLVHFRRWPYRPTLTHGPFLKTDGVSANSPRFRFNNVTFAITPNNTLDNNRVLAGLAQTQATNGCRLLVLGGTHPSSTLINAFQNAGFSVLQDGSGTAATTEWNNRKTAFLGEGGVVTPPVTPSLTSPCTFNVNVGAATLVEPVTLSATTSGRTTNGTSFDLTLPAYDAGDLITICVTADYRNTVHQGNLTFTTPDGETVTTVQDFHTQGASGADNERHSGALFSYVATDAFAGGTMTANWTFSDTMNFSVIRTEKDTFKASGAVLATSLNGDTTGTIPSVAAMTGVQEKARIFALCGQDGFADDDFPPAGWTSRANFSPVSFHQLLLMERDAAATASENVAATNFTTDTTFNWASIGFVILPKGA